MKLWPLFLNVYVILDEWKGEGYIEMLNEDVVKFLYNSIHSNVC